MSFVVKLLFAALALWVVLVASLVLLQGPMLFPRALVGPAPPLPDTSRRLDLTREDGVSLHGVLIRGSNPDLPLLLGFGGNAWNADAVALFLHQVLPEHPVAAFHFRGYAPSTGRPSAQALLNDAEAIHDTLSAGGFETQIAVGFSVGAGIAAHLAAQRPLDGVVLVTPFDSLSAVARQVLPWVPVRLLFRHEMDALESLRAAEVPSALILAARDEVIPPARAEALASGLAESAHPPAFLRRIETTHNAIYSHPDFAPALREAVGALAP